MSVAEARRVVRDTILHYPGGASAPRLELSSLSGDRPNKENIGIPRIYLMSQVLATGTSDGETLVFRLAALVPSFCCNDGGQTPDLNFASEDSHYADYFAVIAQTPHWETAGPMRGR